MEELKLFLKVRKRQSISSSNSVDMVPQVQELTMLRFLGKTTKGSSMASEFVTANRRSKKCA